MKIAITRGLDLSLQGSPKESGFLKRIDPTLVSIDLRPYSALALKLKVEQDDIITSGSPVAEYKNFPGVFITSPVSGTVKEIRRGDKRSLLDIVIKKTPGQNLTEYSYDLSKLSQKELLEIFKKEGLFSLFKQRPFDIPALPNQTPRDIFINLADNRPFTPSTEKHLAVFSSREEGFYVFNVGVRAIAKLFGLCPHIVSTDRLAIPEKDLKSIAHLHKITGPYPSGSPSTHIHYIAPITNEKDIVFTISFQEVLTIGHLFLKGRILNEQVVALAGSGLKSSLRRYVITTKGADFQSLLSLEDISSDVSLISGDPLTGRLCDKESAPCLGMRDSTISVIPNPKIRQAFNFLRLGINKPTRTRTYLSGFLKRKHTYMDPDTNLHGETRPIIDTEIYDKVMPMKIPVVPLIKAVITKDFELACLLGFLEICPEDFALPTFIDPSKTEMLTIIKESLKDYAKETGILNPENEE
ncbi:Na()-translocating NADH-quinone reductase subunit A,Na()-translocating NADH-quinone reductase subunit A,Predicted NADH:ubiquinone oxidoreductase, subunit RnfC,NADH:ubiquinone oxidoreductase, Na()-translocating, A subunit,Na()-translocating NADH-quinone reductase subunit A (NQRA) [Chlamydia poikilotherma]|uniref:Na(+)-translocating NADH-quinone reductase subunit A n=1 Tax=Chlamydia poikilotherma TaxID=1967783 RepID=A0A3B0QEM2_9CHLA|nr:Na(+)-translocating NADH-quinone reductase subunit A [Chlamydia poikilotherma]SYX08494.1 Na()-translocating NADH-quinone reductase subunit A,Na()-translocating NADH-quinone reductase subunit A,Predicted NADH:ubiquinone oxidoreductase, subunit RnfC,NADH:ubiquinone oxidoreductase, Na()-translocating, A subunit,Na()-translocating NADH-quinone reductase subunit A (NQRA) [Chlamydia poikilotherma]